MYHHHHHHHHWPLVALPSILCLSLYAVMSVFSILLHQRLSFSAWILVFLDPPFILSCISHLFTTPVQHTVSQTRLIHCHHQSLVTIHAVTKEIESTALVNYNVVDGGGGMQLCWGLVSDKEGSEEHRRTHSTLHVPLLYRLELRVSGWQCCPFATQNKSEND